VRICFRADAHAFEKLSCKVLQRDSGVPERGDLAHGVLEQFFEQSPGSLDADGGNHVRLVGLLRDAGVAYVGEVIGELVGET
jgi:hypothetical protein